jgi:hypothetical protein
LCLRCSFSSASASFTESSTAIRTFGFIMCSPCCTNVDVCVLMSMRVFMFVYIKEHTYTTTLMSMHVYIYVYVGAYMYTFAFMSVYVYTNLDVYDNMSMNV